MVVSPYKLYFTTMVSKWKLEFFTVRTTMPRKRRNDDPYADPYTTPPEEEPAGRQPVARKTDRREHSNAIRVQCIQMRVDGRSFEDIKAQTGVPRRTVLNWQKRAKERGWEPGRPIREDHVSNLPRSGRPVLMEKGSEEDRVAKRLLKKNSTIRGLTYQAFSLVLGLELKRIRTAANRDLDKPTPKATTIWRWLRRNGFKSLKWTTKPGLNNHQRLRRLAFAMKTRCWTIEDWKRLVWSDETSVVLGLYRGKRRVWRRTHERFHRHCIRRRWKGHSTFMFWACFSYDWKGPCHCWSAETAAQKKKYAAIVDKYNKEHEPIDRENWELAEGMDRLRLDRNKPGKKPRWRYTAARGKMERKAKAGGIDWMRYQYEVLRPKFVPFILRRKTTSDGRPLIAQEDNAGPHASRWNSEYWAKTGIEHLMWPPNSPDLSAMEPPWGLMKKRISKKVYQKTAKVLMKRWPEEWKNLEQEKLQRYVERLPGHIRWVIRLAGGNEYKEGTEPPPLPEGQREPGDIVWEKFLEEQRRLNLKVYQKELLDAEVDEDWVFEGQNGNSEDEEEEEEERGGESDAADNTEMGLEEILEDKDLNYIVDEAYATIERRSN